MILRKNNIRVASIKVASVRELSKPITNAVKVLMTQIMLFMWHFFTRLFISRLSKLRMEIKGDEKLVISFAQ